MGKYTASDGTLWHICYNPKPIPTKKHDWDFVIDDYDGPGDPRHGDAETKEEAIKAIEEYVEFGED